MPYAIRIKRVYEPASRADGARFLVERLWPRGIKKDALQMDGWLREVAPSPALRQWFGHDPAKWPEFQRRYWRELESHPEACMPLLDAARRGPLTLLYSARDTEHNSAALLKAYLEKHGAGTASSGRPKVPAARRSKRRI
jgi:uncharacterized protein YeaO (DUF488 family)